MGLRFQLAIPPVAPPRLSPSRDALRGLEPGEIDWEKWSRHIESRRRRLNGRRPFDGALSTPEFLAEATYVSFKLERLDASEAEVIAALAPAKQRRPLRSRSGQRLRNHAALIRSVDRAVLANQPLTVATAMRWYASISSGLCPADLGSGPTSRLTTLLQRINSPELRLSAALQGIARLHAGAMVDAIFPSFNGILARLLLRYQLGRCGLPPVLFHPDTPQGALADSRHLLPLLMEQIDHSFDVLLA